MARKPGVYQTSVSTLTVTTKGKCRY